MTATKITHLLVNILDELQQSQDGGHSSKWETWEEVLRETPIQVSTVVSDVEAFVRSSEDNIAPSWNRDWNKFHDHALEVFRKEKKHALNVTKTEQQLAEAQSRMSAQVQDLQQSVMEKNERALHSMLAKCDNPQRRSPLVTCIVARVWQSTIRSMPRVNEFVDLQEFYSEAQTAILLKR